MIEISRSQASSPYVGSRSISYQPFNKATIKETNYTSAQDFPFMQTGCTRIDTNDTQNSKNLLLATSSLGLSYDKPSGSSFGPSSPMPSPLELVVVQQDVQKSRTKTGISTSSARASLTPLDLSCNKNRKSGFTSKEAIIKMKNEANQDLSANITILNQEDANNKKEQEKYLSVVKDDVDCSSEDELVRRQKRREQNKAAAQNYRQRKKSTTELIETEHEIALRRNKQLMAYKANLEAQIASMRSLLQDIAMKSKIKEEGNFVVNNAASIIPLNIDDTAREHSQLEALDYSQHKTGLPYSLLYSGTKTENGISSDSNSEHSSQSNIYSQYSNSAPVSPTYQHISLDHQSGNPISFSFRLNMSEDPIQPTMRPRQNTWPMSNKFACVDGLTGKARKKEQNRLASRRFRVRRKVEMSVSEVQLAVLERRNVKLRRICDDFTKKISFMKDVLERLDCKITIPTSLLLATSVNGTPNTKVLKKLSATSSNKVVVS